MVESFDEMLKAVVLLLCVGGCFGTAAMSPDDPGSRLACTSGMLDRVLDRLENIELSHGVKLVKVYGEQENEAARSMKDSLLSRVLRFLTNYELQLKLSDIFQRKQDMTDILRKALGTLNEVQEGNEETSRGKGSGGFGGGKKGGSAILVMATMMGGMMAALGYGALGMLVMKALTVSSMAFLLSAVMGLRRLLRRPDDDAGFGRISYIPVHTEHRKRRSFHDLPYRAYAKQK